jgi:hypothetical protein
MNPIDNEKFEQDRARAYEPETKKLPPGYRYSKKIHATPQMRAAEQTRRGHKPNARQLFPVLRERLLASRPIIPLQILDEGAPSERVIPAHYGAPTFRNRINEKGEWV